MDREHARTQGAQGASDGDMTLRLYGTVEDSIVDGPGLRYSIFVQGCAHACPGCHNPESQPYEGGEVRPIVDIYDEIRANPLLHAVTFSGGEPFDQAEGLAALARMLKAAGFDIWAYSGYLYEDLLKMSDAEPGIGDLLDAIDVLVDGPFVESLKSLELNWKGSSNQRVIDMAKTRAAGTIVEWRQPTLTFEKPANW